MQFAGHQRRRRHPAARANVLDVEILLAKVTFLDGDEMVHVSRTGRDQRHGDIFRAGERGEAQSRDQRTTP